MRSGRHTGNVLLLLIASAVCTLGSLKQQVQQNSSILQLRPQTGQSLALSDFDRDGTAGDGVGRFESSSAHHYAGRCGSDSDSFTAPDESTQETADAGGNTFDQIANGVCSAPRGSAVVLQLQTPALFWSTEGRNPSQRGPPPALI
jgi:hypothetical protein